jgi:hypothetical protein
MKNRTPSYCLHKSSRQAVVRIGGKDHDLGKDGSVESRLKHGNRIAKNASGISPGESLQQQSLTVHELTPALMGIGERRQHEGRKAAVRDQMDQARARP